MDLTTLIQPPFVIFEKGSKACLEYYKSLHLSTVSYCILLSIQVLGKTGSGKTSLIHSLKQGKPQLVDALGRTAVVDVVEVKQDDVLLKITDFGGHDIYELT